MLFEKKLINEILNKVEDEKDRKIISNFDDFFTYLKNYISIREYIFQKDNTSGTIAYRIVSDNFPKFISNMKSYEYAKTICGDELLDLENNLSKYFEEDIKFDEIFSIDNFNAVLSQKGIEKYN